LKSLVRVLGSGFDLLARADPGLVVQEKPRPRKNLGSSKMPGPVLWVQEKAQALVQAQLDLYSLNIF